MLVPAHGKLSGYRLYHMFKMGFLTKNVVHKKDILARKIWEFFKIGLFCPKMF